MIDRMSFYWTWILAFVIVSNATVLLPFSWGVGYYAVLLCSLFIIVAKAKSSLNLTMICLYIAAALSILLNDIPAFFNPWSRLGTFILLTALVSPTLVGKRAAAFKVYLFSAFTLLLVAIVVISVALLFLGMGRSSVFGWFQGAMSHSMLMGPVAVFSSLFCMFLLQYKKHKKCVKYSCVLFVFGGLLCLMQSGSRSALIGCVMSFVAFFWFRYSAQLGRMVRKVIGISIVLVATYPLWSSYADKIIQKNQGDTSSLNTDSRAEHWNQRFEEWEASPLYGIGFASVDIESKSSNFDVSSGGVETGSSWLSVLSMTGILGAGCVMYIFISAFFKCKKILKQSDTIGAFLSSILVFFVFHMMAEGYIFAGGHFLNTQLWLLIGTIDSIYRYPQYVTLLERKLQFN